MKYKSITYDVSIGSYWPEKMYKSQIVLPVGGEFASIKLDLPERIDHPKPMDFADGLLREHMEKTYPGWTYHIWYWNWDVVREDGDS